MHSIQNISSKGLLFLSPKVFSTLNCKYEHDAKVPQELKKNDFLYSRHVGLNEKEISEMLKEFNCKTLDEFMSHIVPKNVFDNTSLHYQEGDATLEPPVTESDFLVKMKKMMQKNKFNKFYLGQGY